MGKGRKPDLTESVRRLEESGKGENQVRGTRTRMKRKPEESSDGIRVSQGAERIWRERKQMQRRQGTGES